MEYSGMIWEMGLVCAVIPGGHYSYSAELFYFPTKKITLACLVNTSRHFSNTILMQRFNMV
ncbi:MAG TPA: hypothetical protein DDW65_09535 [Firmicutes bacterium]|nr:hypothetical protein [Bacillota bacterium]